MKNAIVRRFVCATLFASAGLFTIVACQNNPGPAGRGGVAHVLKGKIHVRNDCDKKANSIPSPLIVSADLSDGANAQVGGKDANVPVKHKAADPNPMKDGDYSITVNWIAGGGVGAAKEWTNIKITDANGAPVCKGISCSGENERCSDIAQKPKTIPIDPSGTTTEDLKITCSCGR